MPGAYLRPWATLTGILNIATKPLADIASKTLGKSLEAIVVVVHANAGEAPSPQAVQKLSIQRAEAIKSYLVQLGVEKNRVYTEGKGEKQPIADNRTAAGRAKNRRAEIEVVITDSRMVQSVVYNAELTPQLPREKTMPNLPIIKAGQQTTLTFYIGPKSEKNVLPGKSTSVSPTIAGSKVDVPLTVLLVCGFCDNHAESLKRVTYKPIKGKTEEAYFRFTPKRRSDDTGYTEKLYLSIVNDQTGREYDRLVLPVAVAGKKLSTITSQGNGIVLEPSAGFAPSTDADSTGWKTDIVLYATVETNRNVSISIQPISKDMKTLLDPLALDAQGARKVFRSGIDDPQIVDAMTNSAYGAMSAVSLQGEILKKLSATGVDAAVSSKSQASLELSDLESGNVVDVIATSGQRLYRHLFYSSADPDLRNLILQLEAAAASAPKNRPLRMTIYTNSISPPWQYLHPVDPEANVNASKFWGMLFSLSVVRANNKATVKMEPNRKSEVRKIVFAQYGSSKDPTVDLAKKQEDQLLKLLPTEPDLVRVDTGADFLAEIRDHRKYIDGIVTFLHASTGSAEIPPNLQFNDGDIVTTDNLEDLLNKVPGEEQDMRYLAGGPLVILNACETGPARNLPQVKLQNAMFQLGARGVVVTEVSVWISLGHEVGIQLIDRLSKGEPISDALTAVRRSLYESKRNPLGLLYVYYGDPTATLLH